MTVLKKSVGMLAFSMSSLFMCSPLLAEVYVVGQKDSAFTKEEITIKKGDSVDFLNQDSYFHNVFSLSDTKFFDLGSYPEGESRNVVFEEAGDIVVECAIHSDMRMVIKVTE
jgi:plastocyanin